MQFCALSEAIIAVPAGFRRRFAKFLSKFGKREKEDRESTMWTRDHNLAY